MFPEIRIEKVDVRGQGQLMRDQGIRRYPALQHQDQTLSALFLTRGRIRRFLDRL